MHCLSVPSRTVGSLLRSPWMPDKARNSGHSIFPLIDSLARRILDENHSFIWLKRAMVHNESEKARSFKVGR